MKRGDADTARRVAAVRGWIFDVDGTLALGDQRLSGYHPLPGAVEVLELLRRRSRPFVAFTNGTTKTPAQYAQTLQHIGLPIDAAQMMTPVSVALEVFRRRKLRKLLVLGAPGVWQPLQEAGFEVVLSPQPCDDADAVFVGWYPAFTLADLEAASRALWAGAPLLTVSLAPYFASRGGRALGVSGAICAALRSITGSRPALVGKPSAGALRSAARRMGLAAAQVAVVGDDPVLEVGMARKAGALAIGVHTGLYDAAAFASAPLPPHLSLGGVHELLPLLEEACP
jgi:4-nitrophenyl phosphatase